LYLSTNINAGFPDTFLKHNRTGAADVHEKCELQFFQATRVCKPSEKEKIEVGFRGLFFFVTFFWRSKRK
jgi:hypothetical protein